MKKAGKIVSVVACAAIFAGCLAGCANSKADKEYLNNVKSYSFWENDLSTAIPQPNIGKMVEDFINTESTNGKAKKVAFIGYDGCRADALINSMKSGATDPAVEGEDFSGHNGDLKYSALNKIIKNDGHVYLAHAGGYTGEDNEQHCSTGPGWASLLTGEWGIKNGITDNGMPKKIEYKTFLMKAAEEKGLRSTFAASWEPHFTENYIDEIAYLKANPTIPMNFEQVADDAKLHEYLLSCVKEGDANEKDIIFGIYEFTDHNGHSTGFGNDNYKYVNGFHNEEDMAYELLTAIENRPSYNNEDWLIVLTTDHGGIETWHGGQTAEERTTWLVTNKAIDQKYYSTNYDGYNNK